LKRCCDLYSSNLRRVGRQFGNYVSKLRLPSP
jgi:hypothetical protein